MTKILPTKAGAYFSRNGVIDFVWFFGKPASPIDRVARFLNVDAKGIQTVNNYSELKG